MRTYKYLVTKKKIKTDYISSNSVSIAFITMNIYASLHWWDSFLIICIESKNEEQVLEYLKKTDRLDIMLVADKPSEYQDFTKQYWKDQDKPLQKNIK